MSVNVDTLNGILRFFRDDQETIDMIVNALEVFEDYHKAIYVLEITRRLYATVTTQSSGIERAQSITARCLVRSPS